MFLCDSWSSCPETKDMQIFYNGVIKNDKEEQNEVINSWYVNMINPLNHKIKYYKALERILQPKSPLLFHACEYKDMHGVQESSTSPLLKKIDFFGKYYSDTCTEEIKSIIWKFVNELNVLCFKAKDEEIPYVPTRAEIQENIKQKRSFYTQDDTPSMHKAFIHDFKHLCDILNTDTKINNKCAEKYIEMWASFAQSSIDSTKITTLCNQHNPVVYSQLQTFFKEFEHATFIDTAWEPILKLNGYATVDQSIPSSMMGKIESLASRIADDISNGNTDFSKLNLNEIGQEVLSQCNEKEMNDFASCIDNLIPALHSFQRPS